MNSTEDNLLAATSAGRKHERANNSDSRNITSHGGIVRDKGDDELEAIDGGREDEEPGKVVEVVIVRIRSTTSADDVVTGDDDKYRPEGTPRTAPWVIGTKSYPARAAFDDVDPPDYIGLYVQAPRFDALELDSAVLLAALRSKDIYRTVLPCGQLNQWVGVAITAALTVISVSVTLSGLLMKALRLREQ